MANELSFQLLFELSNDAIFIVDGATGRILEANEHAALYTKLPIKSLRDSSFEDLFHEIPPNGRDLAGLQFFLKRRDSGPPLPCKMRVRDATWKGARVKIYVLRDRSLQDEVSEDLYLKTEAIAAVGSGVTIADARDPERPLIYVNRGFERLTGYSARETIGRNCRFLQGDDIRQDSVEILRQALREGTPCEVRLRNYRKDGTLFWNELHISPVHSEEGELTHFIGIQLDVTNRVLDRQKLKVSEELKTRFIRMVSHEFRTPMTGIQASASFLKTYGESIPREKRERHFSNIEAALDRMNLLLDDVLFVSRSDAGKVPFNPAPVDLASFCERLVEDVLSLHEGRQVEFSSSLPGDSHFLLDTALLNQILHNLLSNALKYSPAEKPVRLLAGLHENLLSFVVEDNGIGIPEEDRGRLFEPFHRATNVGAVRGTGLGLYIASESAKQHGGKLHFISQPGNGCRFEVHLPAKIPALVS